MKFPMLASVPSHDVRLLRRGNEYFIKTVTVLLFHSKRSAVNFKKHVKIQWGLCHDRKTTKVPWVDEGRSGRIVHGAQNDSKRGKSVGGRLGNGSKDDPRKKGGHETARRRSRSPFKKSNTGKAKEGGGLHAGGRIGKKR